MKGIMVPLLIFWMTGIVIGQQADSSNQFGINSANSSPQTNLPGRNQFNPTLAQPNSAPDSQLAPFELEVSQKDIMGIKYDDEGFLQARIEPIDPQTGKPLPRSVVNGISLIFNGNDSNTTPSMSFSSEPQSHSVQGKNVLAFGITDQDISNLQSRKKLVYGFEFTQRGKFDEVVIFYVPPTTTTPTTRPMPDDAPISNVAFGQRNNNASNVPFIPLPSPDYEPGETNFMGPVHPSQLKPINRGGFGSELAANQQTPSQWRPPTNDTLSNPAISNRPPVQQQTPSRWDLPANEFGQTLPNAPGLNQPATRQPTFEEQVALRKAQLEQDKLAQDLIQRKAILDAYEQDLIEKSAAVRRQEQELANQKYQESLRTSWPSDMNPTYTKPTGPVIGSNIGTGPIVDRPERLASRDLNRFPAEAANSTPPSRAGNQPLPRPTTGGIKDYTASMPGVNANQPLGANANKTTAQRQDKRVEGFVMFMLFCSLGLNIYLGWISRGFYVRYNELADELRETFTATM